MVILAFSFYKCKTTRKYDIGNPTAFTNTSPNDLEPTFKGGVGFTNMVAIEKEGEEFFETGQMNDELMASSGF